jgi:hypothetical protein
MQTQARRLAATLLSALLLSAGGAFAQTGRTSKALLRSDAEAQYLTLKRTFQKLFDEGTIRLTVLRDNGAVDLADCATGSSFLGIGEGSNISSRTRQLADLAYEVVRLKKLAAQLGYPEAAWRPALRQIEEQGQVRFDPFAGRHLETMRAALDAYRRGSAPALPKVAVVGGCGEGEVGIRIATRPANGRVRLIPVFFHKLCEVQEIDPEDPRRCDHWREPAEGALLDVSGDYVYQATWPDGARRSGRMSFTNLEYGQTVTISKP